MGAGHLGRLLRARAPARRRSAASASSSSASELWIERTDYEETPPKGYFRLFPGNKVRLKYGHVIECTGATKDADGNVTEVQAELVPDTKSGTPGADAVKVKGVITWVGVADAREGGSAPVRPPVHGAAARTRRTRTSWRS